MLLKPSCTSHALERSHRLEYKAPVQLKLCWVDHKSLLPSQKYVLYGCVYLLLGLGQSPENHAGILEAQLHLAAWP